MSTVLLQVVAARAGVGGVPKSPQVRRQPVSLALSWKTPRWELGTGRSSNPGWRRVSGTRRVSSALTRGREGLFCRSSSLFGSFFNSSRSAGVSCCRSGPGSPVRTTGPPSLLGGSSPADPEQSGFSRSSDFAKKPNQTKTTQPKQTPKRNKTPKTKTKSPLTPLRCGVWRLSQVPTYPPSNAPLRAPVP